MQRDNPNLQMFMGDNKFYKMAIVGETWKVFVIMRG